MVSRWRSMLNKIAVSVANTFPFNLASFLPCNLNTRFLYNKFFYYPCPIRALTDSPHYANLNYNWNYSFAGGW